MTWIVSYFYCQVKRFLLLSCMNIIFVSFMVGMALFYLYETPVLWEYIRQLEKIFHKSKKSNILFNGILLIKAYESTRLQMTYPHYLNKIYDNFFTRLLSCPICLGFWMSAAASGLIFEPMSVGVVSALSLMVYYSMKYLTTLSARL